MTFDYLPLSGALGAELRGVDLSSEVDEGLFAEIRECWNQANGLLVIRDQNLSETDHIGFSRRFGPLHTLQGHAVTKYLHPEHPEIYRVSNKVLNGVPQGRKGAGTYWHSDQSYEKEPAMASLLYALEIPPYGGDTVFAGMCAAYEALSSPMKGFLEGLEAVHWFGTARSGGFRNENVTSDQLEKFPPVRHPVVRTHSETGRKCLFINPGFTSHIEGLKEEESDALLRFLFQHSTRADFQYRHVWRQHDLVIWDNRCTMHYAIMDYDGLGDRLMHRCTTIGEEPLNASVAA